MPNKLALLALRSGRLARLCATRDFRHGLLGPTYQLKVIQESITLTVFAVFAYFYLDEAIRWNYVASFACLFGAVLFAFWSTF